MKDKEKETIEYWKKELYQYEYTKDLDLASDNYFGQFEEKINMIRGILNIIQTQQEEIERLKNMYGHLSRDSKKAVDYTFELNEETEKQDKIIDLMAERLSYVEDLKLDVCVYCKEDCRIPRNQGDYIKNKCIKEYFTKKVEKEGKDE